MTTLYQDIKQKLSNLFVLEKIIIINTVIFIITGLINFMISSDGNYIFDLFSLSENIIDNLINPWTFFTYGFLHHSFHHLFYNMLFLYIISRSFSNLFAPKMSLKIYFLGIIWGGLAFMSVVGLFPDILKIKAPLVGASAGVRACIIFLCSYFPNKIIGFFTLRFRLKYLGIALIIFDLPGIFSFNSGGVIAHFGGYLLGFTYAKKLQNGKDLGYFLDKILDSFSSKSSLKTVFKVKSNKFKRNVSEKHTTLNHQKRIDKILDKISDQGYDSLSKEEKEFLFRSSKK